MSVSSVILGQAAVRIILDDGRLTAGLDRAQEKLFALKQAFGQFGQAATSIGLFAVPGVTLAVKEFANFDDAMRTVQAVTGSTGASFSALTDQALKLGRETSFTASQVAQGMVSLGRMGFSDKQISASIADVMNLSRATGTDLAQAAQIAANNMTVFGLEASQMGMVADVMTVTANSSAQTLEDLGEALKMAGPHAKRAGADLQETSAALGILANMGIRGSLAGTALGKSFKRLADTDVQEYLKGFGIETVDANGNLKNMAVLLTQIGKAAAKMGSAEQINFMEKIFDARGSLGGGVLSFNVAGMDAFLQKLRNSKDAAAQGAAGMDAGTGGTLRELSSAAEGARIEFGRIAAVSFTPLLLTINEALLAMREFMGEGEGLISLLLQMGAGVIALGLAIKGLGLAGGLTANLAAPIMALDKMVVSMSAVKAATVAAAHVNTLNTAAAATDPALRATLNALGMMPVAGTAAATGSTIAAKGMAVLKGAMTALMAHPVMATLLAVAGVLAIMKLRADAATKALQDQYDAARDTADAATAARQAGDTERQEVGVKFARLQQLQEMSETAPLAAEQVQELNSLLAELNKYGSNEWASFDTLTGKLTLAADAQQQLNDKMAQAAKLQLEAELATAGVEKNAAQELKNNAENGLRINPFTSEAGRVKDIEAADAKIMAAMKKEMAIRARLRALEAGDTNAIIGVDAPPAKGTAERVQEHNEQKEINAKTYAKFAGFLGDMDSDVAEKRERKMLDATIRDATPEELASMEVAETQKLAAARQAYTQALEEAAKATSDGGSALTDEEQDALLAKQSDITKRQDTIDAIAAARGNLDAKLEQPGNGLAAGALAGFVTTDVMAMLGGGTGGPEEETAKNTRAMAENIAVMIDVIRTRKPAAFA